MQDIKPLLVFATVLEHGSMNAAAAALGMTPSAVSQHINRLETLHGIKLLNRSTRSLAPTDAGRALGEYCRRLAATLADTRTVIDNLKTEPVGELRISLTSCVIGSRAFQTAFSRLQTEFPKSVLSLISAIPWTTCNTIRPTSPYAAATGLWTIPTWLRAIS